MSASIKKILDRIREAEEPIRRRWLIALTGISMIFVISLWAFYVNVSLKPLNEEADAGASQVEPGFFSIMAAGFNKVAYELSSGAALLIENASNKVKTVNLITVNRQEVNFLPEHLEPIPKTPLP
ncbi:MAG TPA: hypothetical protein VJB92_02325 [Candidatus Paceibacterota bacterium]